MLEINLHVHGSQTQEYRSLMQEAFLAFPYFHNIYFFAARAIAPNYGGSPAQVEALAQGVVQRTKDREGEMMHARIYWTQDNVFQGNPFRNGNAKWPLMKRSFENLVSKYPEARNLSMYAKMACQADDLAAVRHALTLVGDKLDLSMWSYVDPAKMDKCFSSVN